MLLELLEDRCVPALLTLQIVPELSAVSLTASAVVNGIQYPGIEQSPGSLLSQLVGEISVNYTVGSDYSSLQVESSQIEAVHPSDQVIDFAYALYSSELDASLPGAISDLVFQLSSNSIDLFNGEFEGSLISSTIEEGTLQVFSFPYVDLATLELHNNSSDMAIVEDSGDLLRLSFGLDVSAEIPFEMDFDGRTFAGTGFIRFQGQIVAEANMQNADPGGSITGIVFDDLNENGVQDDGELGYEGVTLYLDANGDGIKNDGDRSVTTDSSGTYTFGGLATGEYVIRQIPLPGTESTMAGGDGAAVIVVSPEEAIHHFSNRSSNRTPLQFDTVLSGEIERIGSRDEWTFTIATDRIISFEVFSISGSGRGIDFVLVDDNDKIIFGENATSSYPYYGNHGAKALTAGTYTLIAAGSGTSTATYEFMMHDVTLPDTSELSFDTVLSGEVERIGSRDEWTFTIATDRIISFEVFAVSGSGQSIDFVLVDDDDTIIFRENATSSYPYYANHGAKSLTAGTYTLVASDSGTSTATYTFRLNDVIPPDTDDLRIGQTVFGDIEQLGGRDEWTFDGFSGQRFSLDVQSITNVSGNGLSFTLVGPSGYINSRTGTAGSPGDANFAFTLPEIGEYRLVVTGVAGSTGSYSLRVVEENDNVRTWTGQGGDFEWSNPDNWSNSIVPASDEDVFINISGDHTVIIRSNVVVRSLNSESSISIVDGGSLSVAADSIIEGSLSIVRGNMKAEGPGVALRVVGDVQISGGSLIARGGAAIILPGLTSYATGSEASVIKTFRAEGVGSRLDLSNLITFVGSRGVGGAAARIYAVDGGTIDLSSLSRIDGGVTQILADGAGSAINLSALTRFEHTGVNVTSARSSIQAKNGGTILGGKLDTLIGVDLTIDGTGNLDTAQIKTFARGTLTAVGTNPDLTGLTSAVESEFVVTSGGRLSLHGLIEYDAGVVGTRSFRAVGPTSVLEFLNLEELAGSTGTNGAALRIEAIGGGIVDLRALMSINGGVSQIQANGAGSVVDISSLSYFKHTIVNVTSARSSIQAKNGGTILGATLDTLLGVDLTVDGTGHLDTAQITTFEGGTLTVIGTNPDLTRITRADEAGFVVTSGGRLSLPGMTEYDAGVVGIRVFRAEGADSLLELQNLEELAGSTGTYGAALRIEAIDGGVIDLNTLSSISHGVTQILAEGTGSIVDVSALTSFTHTTVNVTSASSSLLAKSGGSILNGSLTNLSGVDLSFDGTGALSTSQISTYINGTITVHGIEPDLSGITRADESEFIVTGGGMLSLPGLTSYAAGQDGYYEIRFRAEGADSLLDLSQVQTMTGGTGSYYATLAIQAVDGGRIVLSSVTSITNGGTDIYADGHASDIDLSALEILSTNDTFHRTSTIQSNDGAMIHLGVDTTEIRDVDIIASTGTLSAGAIVLGTGSNLYGVGTITANVINQAAVHIGSSVVGSRSLGSLTITGSFEQSLSGKLYVELAGLVPVTEFDQLVVGGAVTLGGRLAITRHYQNPQFGDFFEIIQGAEINGEFDSLTGYQIEGNRYLGPGYRLNAFLLIVDGEPGLSDIFVPEDAPPSLIDLRNGFKLPGPRTYSVVSIQSLDEENPEEIPFEHSLAGSLLTLTYKLNAFVNLPVKVTVRAVNGDGVAAEADFKVMVFSVNDAPVIHLKEIFSEAEIEDGITIPFGTTETMIDLRPAVSDIETARDKLHLTVLQVTNSTIFSSSPAIDAEGRLALHFAENAFGIATITVAAVDTAGAVGVASFSIRLGETEPLDSFDQAGRNETLPDASDLGALPTSLMIHGNIHAGFGEDVDYYRFHIEMDAVYRIDLFAERIGGTLDAAMALFSDPTEVETLKLSDDVMGNDPSMLVALEAGTYYLRVGSTGATLGAYSLQFSRIEAAPQILRMTPSRTVASSPTEIVLQLGDGVDSLLQVATVNVSAFSLQQLGPDGDSVSDVSDRIASATWDEATRRITLSINGSLVDGMYRLTAKDSLKNVGGIQLDGDRDGSAGGDFIREFAIDSTAPVGSIKPHSISNGLYRFELTVSDGFPAQAGETVLVRLDVDGDGFDDGSALVTLGEGPSLLLATTTPIPFGQESVLVRAELEDLRGNIAVVETTLDTRIAVVTSVKVDGNQLKITFSLDGLVDVGKLSSYQVTNIQLADVAYDSQTRTATLSFAGNKLETGTYNLTVLSNPTGDPEKEGVHFLHGDGSLDEKRDFVQTITVDRDKPIVKSVSLGDAADDNLTNLSMPTLKLNVTERFPSTTTGTLTARIDVDNDGFDDGLATVVLDQFTYDQRSATAVFDVQVTKPLAIGGNTIRVQVIDAVGNASEVFTYSIQVDREGPRVVLSQTEVNSERAEITLDFSERVDISLEDLRLLRAGNNGSFENGSIVTEDWVQLRVNTVHGDASRAIVEVEFAANAPESGEYRLVVLGSTVNDRAGNPLLAGNYTTDFQFRRSPPKVVDVALTVGLSASAPGKLVVSFDDSVLDESSVENSGNYRVLTSARTLVTIEPQGTYDAFARQVVFSVTEPLPAGVYTITVTGIQNRQGVAMTTPTTRSVTVPIAGGEEPQNLTVFDQNAKGLENYAASTLPAIEASTKVLTSRDFANRLLSMMEIAYSRGADINETLRDLFLLEQEAELFGKSYLSKEFAIFWTFGAQFLLYDPSDDPTSPTSRVRLGFGLDGSRIEEIEGAILAGSSDGFAIAIIPIQSLGQFVSDSFAKVDGAPRLPDLIYAVELEGTRDDVRLAGSVYFGESKAPGSITFSMDDIPPEERVRVALDLTDSLSGYDPNLRKTNELVLASIASIVGSYNSLENNLLILWFDPVDFRLKDAQARQVGFGAFDGAAAQTYNTVATSYYSGNGFTELLIWTDAPPDIYTLELLGLGTRYGGYANFFPITGARYFTPLEGLLGSRESLVATLDWGYRPTPNPPVTNPPVTNPSPPVTVPGPTPVSPIAGNPRGPGARDDAAERFSGRSGSENPSNIFGATGRLASALAFGPTLLGGISTVADASEATTNSRRAASSLREGQSSRPRDRGLLLANKELQETARSIAFAGSVNEVAAAIGRFLQLDRLPIPQQSVQSISRVIQNVAPGTSMMLRLINLLRSSGTPDQTSSARPSTEGARIFEAPANAITAPGLQLVSLPDEESDWPASVDHTFSDDLSAPELLLGGLAGASLCGGSSQNGRLRRAKAKGSIRPLQQS